jgi:hypothetical protein
MRAGGHRSTLAAPALNKNTKMERARERRKREKKMRAGGHRSRLAAPALNKIQNWSGKGSGERGKNESGRASLYARRSRSE